MTATHTHIGESATLRSKLPRPGAGRFWHIVHDPSKVKTPVRVELRAKQIQSAEARVSMSRLIGKDWTVADETAIIEKAAEVHARVSRVDELEGVYT